MFVLLVAVAVLIAVELEVRPAGVGALRRAGGGHRLGHAHPRRGPRAAAPARLASQPRAGSRSQAPRVGWVGVGRIAAVTLACAAVLAPWVIRNAVVFGRPLLATDSNTLIAGANCPDTYYGHDIGWWSLRCMERARTRVQVSAAMPRPPPLGATPAITSGACRGGRGAGPAHVRPLPAPAPGQPRAPPAVGRRRRARVLLPGPVARLLCGWLRLRSFRWELLAPVVMVVLVSAAGWGIGRFRVAADVSLLVLAASALAAGLRPRPPWGWPSCAPRTFRYPTRSPAGDEFRRLVWSHAP